MPYMPCAHSIPDFYHFIFYYDFSLISFFYKIQFILKNILHIPVSTLTYLYVMQCKYDDDDDKINRKVSIEYSMHLKL